MEFLKNNWKLIAAGVGLVLGGMIIEKTARPIGRIADSLKDKAENPIPR
ncbi:MAG: hypothetical protein ABFE07_27985 [Armatimonadia bacterium]